jgi:DedD protein
MAVGTQMSAKDSDQVQDTEITLGTGKLLGIFFALAIVCGLFFTMGYMLGKNTSSGARTEIIDSVPSAGSAAVKPAAGNRAPQAQTCPQDNPNCAATAANSGSTDANTATSTAADNSASSSASAAKPADQSNTQATSGDAKAGATGSFIVQVAAVSKQEDAELLKTALQKKQYPVFIANSAGDPLFHVQVGPFTDRKDAEVMKTKLAGDGYMAIVK